jgi:hypothetical protein
MQIVNNIAGIAITKFAEITVIAQKTFIVPVKQLNPKREHLVILLLDPQVVFQLLAKKDA